MKLHIVEGLSLLRIFSGVFFKLGDSPHVAAGFERILFDKL